MIACFVLGVFSHKRTRAFTLGSGAGYILEHGINHDLGQVNFSPSPSLDTAITRPCLWHNELHGDNVFVDPHNPEKVHGHYLLAILSHLGPL